MNTEEEIEWRTKRILWPIATGGAVLAVCGQAEARFIDPVWLSGIGLWFVVAAGFVIGSITTKQSLLRIVELTLGIILLVIAVWKFSDLERKAAAASRANDVRCFAIQQSMVSGRGNRSDFAAMFQALGCRPQGTDSVVAPVDMRTLAPGSSGSTPPARH